jgi:hypothetical protein
MDVEIAAYEGRRLVFHDVRDHMSVGAGPHGPHLAAANGAAVTGRLAQKKMLFLPFITKAIGAYTDRNAS